MDASKDDSEDRPPLGKPEIIEKDWAVWNAQDGPNGKQRFISFLLAAAVTTILTHYIIVQITTKW